MYTLKRMFLKNAEFGKPYKTREGRKAVFLKYLDQGCLLLIQRDFGFTRIKVSDKGKHFSDKDWDIVSEWES